MAWLCTLRYVSLLYVFSIGIFSDKHAVDYLPVYYQAVKLASTIRSGVYMLGFSMFITPAAMVCGVSFMVFNRYLPQNYVGWILMVAGSGVLAVLGVDSSKAAIISAPIMVGMGVGMGWTMTQFPILASLPYSNNAHALSFFTFVRNLSQVSRPPLWMWSHR